MRNFFAAIALLVVTGFGNLLLAQGQITLYQMHRSIPQANLMNPAFYNETKNVVVGLPVLNSTYLSFRSPASFDEAFNRVGDSLVFDSDSFLGKLKENNRLDLDANISVLFVGVRMGEGVLTVGVNSRVDGGLAIPGDFLQFIIEGSGEDPNDVSTLSLNDTDARYQVFHEIYGSYNRRINDKLIVGGRVKFLKGLFNLDLDNFGGSISTSIDSINLQSNAFTLQTAGFDDPSTSYFSFGSGNNGIAFDLGATYEVIPNLYLAASVLDLGSIRWKDNVKSFSFDEVNYTFDGVDLLELIENENNNNPIDQELDSLGNLFDPVETNVAYSTPLVPKFYLSGNYRLGQMHQFGLIFYGDLFKSDLRGAVGMTYDITLSKILSAGINASYKNRRIDNIGLGLSVMLGPIQIYGMADRMNAVFNPESADLFSFRAGMNLVFGKTNDGSIIAY